MDVDADNMQPLMDVDADVDEDQCHCKSVTPSDPPEVQLWMGRVYVPGFAMHMEAQQRVQTPLKCSSDCTARMSC
jgi:hypothetical protein